MYGGAANERWSGRGFALAVFILSVFPRSLSPPLPPLTSLCSASNPFHPSELREGWCALFFAFVTPLFQRKASLIETEGDKKKGEIKKKKKRQNQRSSLGVKGCVKNEERITAALKRWPASAAECIHCIVRPCVQKPWYCLHSLINVFCMV